MACHVCQKQLKQAKVVSLATSSSENYTKILHPKYPKCASWPLGLAFANALLQPTHRHVGLQEAACKLALYCRTASTICQVHAKHSGVFAGLISNISICHASLLYPLSASANQETEPKRTSLLYGKHSYCLFHACLSGMTLTSILIQNHTLYSERDSKDHQSGETADNFLDSDNSRSFGTVFRVKVV